MPLARATARLHQRLRSTSGLQRFTLLCRTLLALGFVSPGLTKVFGNPFANPVDPATPLGEIPQMLAFFEVFHHIGPYYRFVGVVQTAAALLLLSRRTALLGAMLYLPVIVNISILTVATHFGPFLGTQLITILMALACAWLLVWDAHRLVPLFSRRARSVPKRPKEPALWQMLVPRPAPGGTPPRGARMLLRSVWLLGFASAMTCLLAMRSHFGRSPLAQSIFTGAFFSMVAAALLTIAGWALWWWTDHQSSMARR